MNRPLALVALCYAGGLGLGYSLSPPVGWSFIAATVMFVGLVGWPRARPYLLGPAFAVLGWTNLSWRTAVLAPDDLRVVTGERSEVVTLEGRLCAAPTLRVFERKGQTVWRSLALVEVEVLHRRAEDVPVRGCVTISTPGVLDAQFYGGQSVAVSGVLRLPKEAAADGLFDYREFLKWQGIYYQLDTAGTNDWRLTSMIQSRAGPPWSDRFCEWGQRILALGLPGEDESLRLVWAMALGWKTGLTDEVSASFIQTGTMHIFAISGLHIALIAGILVQILRVVRVPRGACGLLVIPLIWFYTVATGWQASAIRSAIMMTVVICGWALRRPGDLVNSLAAAGLIILIYDPCQLFQPGFQLSFFVVLSIALFHPSFAAVRRRLLQTDPLLLPESRPRWQGWLVDSTQYLTASLATSVAAWLGSIPLIAWYFHMVTPVSLLDNLVIVPLSSLCLASNMGSLVCGTWLSSLTVLFNHCSWFLMACMVQISRWTAALPGAYFYVPPPGLIGFLLYYGVVFTVCTGWIFKPQRIYWTGMGIGLLAIIWLGQWWCEEGMGRVTVLALGGGDAIYVRGQGRHNDWLIDTGSESAAEFVTIPYLHGQGVNHLSHLCLTHGDQRHMGGAELVAEKSRVRNIYISPAPARSPTYRRLVHRSTAGRPPMITLGRGDTIGPWRVMHPPRAAYQAQADNNAMVLLGEFQRVRVLLLSDLGPLGQEALLAGAHDLRADIVIAGIPARGEPLGDSLLTRVQPRAVVLSTGENSAVSRGAAKALRLRLTGRGILLMETEQDRSVSLLMRRGRCELRGMSGQRIFLDCSGQRGLGQK
jgi:competence protein ComEC